MDGRLDRLSGLKDRDLAREGLMLAEGRDLCRRLLRSGLPVQEVWGSASALDFLGPDLAARPEVAVQVASEARMSAVLGFDFHRGVLALAKLAPLPGLQDFLGRPALEGPAPRILTLPALGDPENLGAIIRSASALGWDGIVLGPHCPQPFSRRVIRVSMGGVFSLPVCRVSDPGDLAVLVDRGYEILGTGIESSSQVLPDYLEEGARMPPRPLCLMLGHEYRGLDAPWRACCQRILRIPMAPGPDSLNVAASAAIFCHALGRPSALAPG